MKNLSLTLLLALFAFASTSFAQTGKKALKEAEKVIKKYAKNPLADDVDLASGITLLSTAFESEEVSGEAKNWIKKGELLVKISDAAYLQYATNPSYKSPVPTAATDAYDAFSMAMELGETKKAAKGISEVEGHLNNAAALFYQEKDYESAYMSFKKSLDARDVLKENGKESRLDKEPGLLDDQILFTAVSGFYGGKAADAKPYFLQLKDNGKTDAVVYEALYSIYTEEGDADKALATLEEGRIANPDDSGLLFSEINHYLTSGNLETLIVKLEQAIEKEPDNVSVYVTLGSVYDQLHQKASKDGDSVKAKEYFAQALSYYNQTLEKEPENFDATYSIGALYYNKAAGMVGEINELANDFSSAGMKKYDAKKAEMDGIFKEALPSFERAETLKPDDRNTVIALKEIYARLNMLDKSEIYKAKLEGM